MTQEQKRRRLLLVGALVVAAGAFSLLAFGNIGDNLVYYWSPSELLDEAKRARGANVRLGGLVSAGSVVRSGDGTTLYFAVTDGERTVPVHARAVPPAMFREGIGVVLEGSLRADGVFESSRLLVKHDNEYRAPGRDDTRSVQELVKTLNLNPGET